MESTGLIPHLFRTEFRKITAVLGKQFGIGHLAMAEDIASETFLSAMENWSYNGLPPNPVAWLYTVAKNKAKNRIKRELLLNKKIVPELKYTAPSSEEIEIDLSQKNSTDSQLQMLFAICHPSIPKEAQVGLSLRILCGFGIEEIANAFLSNKETITKRLFRAREKLREEKVPVEFPPDKEVGQRLDTVLTTLYLLFNEGYYSQSGDSFLRKDLCLEAIRLTEMLIENPLTNRPIVSALLALMYFQSSRLEARISTSGDMILYDEQDTSLWDFEMISKGGYFLHKASTGETISKYHLEAAIAYWHTIKEDSIEKWESILLLFDQLLEIDYSPMAALNRIYVLSKVKGKETAINELKSLDVTGNPFYHTLLGELYSGIDYGQAIHQFQKAYSLVQTDAEKRNLSRKMELLGR